MRAVCFVNKLCWELPGSVFRHGLVIGDVDNDGENELVVGTAEGDLYIFKIFLLQEGFNEKVGYEWYCLQSKDCSATYIGESKRTLGKRINEHKNKNTETVVNKHQSENNHSFNFEDAIVIDRESTYKKKRISEMIHIKCNDFTINKKEDVQFLSNTYFPLLSKLKE